MRPIGRVAAVVGVLVLFAGVFATSASTAAAEVQLTDDEASGILYVREEEKLARDVYLTLYDVWGAPVFERIAQSEVQHMAAMLTLIERYGLNDPVADNPVGMFEDVSLQALYDDLVARGSESLEAALLVGGFIEELDVVDLEDRMDATDRADIDRVYANLLRGSRNHLRAFVQTYEAQSGAVYPAQVLDAVEIDSITDQAVERGGSAPARGAKRGGPR